MYEELLDRMVHIIQMTPEYRYALFAEGDGDGEGGSGEGEGEGKGDGQAAGEGEGGAKAATSDDNWRSGIQDEKLRDHAGRFTSVLDLVGKHYELRQQLSTAIQPLSSDATDEQVTSYRKAIGAPDTVEGYEFAMPEGQEATDADKAFQSSTAEMFHGLNITSAQANGLNEWWNELRGATLEAQVADDKAYADETLAELKREWPGAEFDRNKQFADFAAVKVFGDALDEVRNIETKDGRFILDHPSFVKMLAQYGREMEEGTLGGAMTDSDRDSIQGEIDDLGKQIDKAKAEGDRSKANTLYVAQQELYRKSYGAGSIVGAEGRVA